MKMRDTFRMDIYLTDDRVMFFDLDWGSFLRMKK